MDLSSGAALPKTATAAGCLSVDNPQQMAHAWVLGCQGDCHWSIAGTESGQRQYSHMVLLEGVYSVDLTYNSRVRGRCRKWKSHRQTTRQMMDVVFLVIPLVVYIFGELHSVDVCCCGKLVQRVKALHMPAASVDQFGCRTSRGMRWEDTGRRAAQKHTKPDCCLNRTCQGGLLRR